MELSDIFSSETQVSFVFPFKLSLSCVIFEGKDEEVQFDYDRWKSRVICKLICHKNSSDGCYLFSWDEVAEDLSDSSSCEFLPNCFLKAKIEDSAKLGWLNDCLRDFKFNGLGLEVSCVEMKLWEFGFGSIKIVSKVISDLLDGEQKSLSEVLDDFQTMLNEKFLKILEPKIDYEIIWRCNFQRKDDPKEITSFAEIALKHKKKTFQQKNKDYTKYNFDLLEPISTVQSKIIDENDDNVINMQSSGLRRIETKDEIEGNSFKIYISNNRKLLVSIFQQNSEEYDKIKFNEIIETVIVHKEFGVYLNKIGQTYEPFLSTYSDKIAKESIHNSKLWPDWHAFAWNVLQEKKGLDTILTEIQEVSRISIIMFNTLDSQANSYLSYSNLSTLKIANKIFDLNRIRDSNNELFSLVNRYYAKISNHNEKLSLFAESVIAFYFPTSLSFIALILSFAAIDGAFGETLSNVIRSTFPWNLSILPVIAVIVLSLLVSCVERAEKREIENARKPGSVLETHQLWIEMLETEKTM